MNQVLKTIRNRRSVRLYKPEQTKEEELQAILEAGIWAPSGHNGQPWHFTVIQNKELIDHMSQVCLTDMAAYPIDWIAKMGKTGKHIFHNAPTVIVVSGRKEAFLNPVVDCSAAIENMLLAAESLDIGSCWIGLARFFFDKPEELKALNLPEGYEPFYAVTFGYKEVPNGKGLARKAGTISYIR